MFAMDFAPLSTMTCSPLNVSSKPPIGFLSDSGSCDSNCLRAADGDACWLLADTTILPRKLFCFSLFVIASSSSLFLAVIFFGSFGGSVRLVISFFDEVLGFLAPNDGSPLRELCLPSATMWAEERREVPERLLRLVIYLCETCDRCERFDAFDCWEEGRL